MFFSQTLKIKYQANYSFIVLKVKEVKTIQRNINISSTATTTTTTTTTTTKTTTTTTTTTTTAIII